MKKCLIDYLLISLHSHISHLSFGTFWAGHLWIWFYIRITSWLFPAPMYIGVRKCDYRIVYWKYCSFTAGLKIKATQSLLWKETQNTTCDSRRLYILMLFFCHPDFHPLDCGTPGAVLKSILEVWHEKFTQTFCTSFYRREKVRNLASIFDFSGFWVAIVSKRSNISEI